MVHYMVHSMVHGAPHRAVRDASEVADELSLVEELRGEPRDNMAGRVAAHAKRAADAVAGGVSLRSRERRLQVERASGIGE